MGSEMCIRDRYQDGAKCLHSPSLAPLWLNFASSRSPFAPFFVPFGSLEVPLGLLLVRSGPSATIFRGFCITFGSLLDSFFGVFRSCFLMSFFEGVFDDFSDPFSIKNDGFGIPFGIAFRVFVRSACASIRKGGFRFEPAKTMVFCVYS